MLGWIAVPVGVFVLYAFLGDDDDAGDGEAQPGREPWTGPIWVPASDADLARVRDYVCAAGRENPTAAVDVIAGAAWAQLQPGVPWPILEQDSQRARQAAGAVLGIAKLFKDAVDAGAVDAFCGATRPDDAADEAGYDLREWENNAYPTPGRFYQVRSGDILGGTNSERSVLYRTLLSAGFMAARMVGGLDVEAARAWALDFAKSSQDRAVYRGLLLCGRYNDGFFATYGFGEDGLPGPTGRGLRFLAMHPPNRERLRQGLTPMRSIPRGQDGDQKSGTAIGTGDDFEYLWLPGLDPEAIWHGTTPDDRIRPLEWQEDGRTTIDPPPAIWRRINWQILPPGDWGCASAGTEFISGG